MEKIGNYIVGGKVKWYNYFGKVWQFLNTNLSCGPANPLPREIKTYVCAKNCTQVFIAGFLF